MSITPQQTLLRHFNRCLSTPTKFFKLALGDNDDISQFYLLLQGLPPPFDKGEYLATYKPNMDIKLPPDFRFLTPNGFIEVNHDICVSNGKFHSDQFNNFIGMYGFITSSIIGIFLTFRDMGGGIGLNMSVSDEKIKRLAVASPKWNREHYGEVIAKIESNFDFYSTKWDLKILDVEMLQSLNISEELKKAELERRAEAERKASTKPAAKYGIQRKLAEKN